MSTKNPEGRIAGIALRGTDKRGPLTEVAEATATTGGGIEPERKVSAARGITFLSKEQWAEVTAELGEAMPWHTRRANVLVEGLDLRPLVGKVIEVGPVRVRIDNETQPCGLMDELRPGLRAVLTPDLRGGIHGEVLQGGAFKVGDTVRVVE